MRKRRRLPNGEETESVECYLKAWTNLANRVLALPAFVGWDSASYDPGINLVKWSAPNHIDGKLRPLDQVNLSVELAEALCASFEQPTKIWLVESWDDDNQEEIFGAFTSLEKAERYVGSGWSGVRISGSITVNPK